MKIKKSSTLKFQRVQMIIRISSRIKRDDLQNVCLPKSKKKRESMFNNVKQNILIVEKRRRKRKETNVETLEKLFEKTFFGLFIFIFDVKNDGRRS